MRIENMAKKPIENYKLPTSDIKKMGELKTPDMGNGNEYQQVITEDIITKKVSKVNEDVKQLNPDLEVSYKVHEGTNTFIIQFTDKKIDQVVLEFPSSKVLDYAADITGPLLIDEKV